MKLAEFVLQNGRFAFFKAGGYTARAKTVCRHCGYQKPNWNFRGMRLEAEGKFPSVGFAYSDRDDLTYLIPSEIAATIRSAWSTAAFSKQSGDVNWPGGMGFQ